MRHKHAGAKRAFAHDSDGLRSQELFLFTSGIVLPQANDCSKAAHHPVILSLARMPGHIVLGIHPQVFSGLSTPKAFCPDKLK